MLEQKKPKEMDPAQVISYLRSRPKDDSTLGGGDHLRRQAKMFLMLWNEHVLKGYVPDGDGDFIDRYRVIALGSAGDKDPAKPLGMDIDGIELLRKQVADDQKKLADFGIAPGSDDDRAKRYCFKLHVGLLQNFKKLQSSTEITGQMYELVDLFKNHLTSGAALGLVVETFNSRHNTDVTGMGVQTLYDVMLPILIEKLVAAGYPDSTEEIEWDYKEAPKARGLGIVVQATRAISHFSGGPGDGVPFP